MYGYCILCGGCWFGWMGAEVASDKKHSLPYRAGLLPPWIRKEAGASPRPTTELNYFSFIL